MVRYELWLNTTSTAPLSNLGWSRQRSSCQLAILYNTWQCTVNTSLWLLTPGILLRFSWFLRFCDVGVKYLKWSKLGELVAKILINCFKAVKFTEILTQQHCTLVLAGSSTSIYWVNFSDSANQYCNVNCNDKSEQKLSGFIFWLHPAPAVLEPRIPPNVCKFQGKLIFYSKPRQNKSCWIAYFVWDNKFEYFRKLNFDLK